MNRPNRTRVTVIGGGQNCEHAVSLATAAAVCRALDPGRYEVVPLTIDEDGGWRDAAGTRLAGLGAAAELIAAADVVFPAVHGPRGEDGTLAALCELAGVPYVGSGVRAGAVAMDKWTTKLVAEALGIRTARGVLVTDAGAPPALPAPPLVVKPVAAGSSYGVTRVDDPADLDRALKSALALGSRALVEEVVDGREVDIAVLGLPDGGRRVGPALEIVVDDGAVFDTGRKYDGSADFRVPAQLDAADLAGLRSAALALFDALDCAGVARFDFFVTRDGLVLNEVNTMPGMTEQSQVPKMFAAEGVSYAALLDALIEGALARPARSR